MCLQKIVSGIVIVLLGHVFTEVWGSRRQYDLQRALMKEVKGLQESQELLQGEVISLRDTVNTLITFLKDTLPEDCSAARTRGTWTSVTQVRPPGLPPRTVRCDQWTEGGGWTVILARRPTHSEDLPRLDFNRTWVDYKYGFGHINGEFWIGNEVLHTLTREAPHQLLVTLIDWNGSKAFATWDSFRVESETRLYRLNVHGYNHESTAGDSLRHHNHHPFSTFDHENDNDTLDHCAQKHGGGWWYFTCYVSHLTGTALGPSEPGDDGIIWRTWSKTLSLREVSMMIRPPPSGSP